MTLTDAAIRKSKSAVKPRRLFDGGGLYLEISPAGGKWWRFKYRFGGREKRLSLGTYPDTSLADARGKRDEVRQLLARGVDPGVQRKAARAAGEERQANSFAVIAGEWLMLQKARMAPATFEKARWTFDQQVNPWIGDSPITEIVASDVLALLRRIEQRGARETAHRTKQRCSQVFRYAIATGRAIQDPTFALRNALGSVVTKSRAAITDPAKVADLLRAINGYQGTPATKCALRLAPLVFVRPGELRNAEWQEINLDCAEWRIPAARMKMREEHIVPLSHQAVKILRELHTLTGAGRYLFPGYRGNARTMSENTINSALRYMGFDKETMTGHGFRALASTRLNEMGWSPDVIERQLAHVERNRVRAVYNRAQYMNERVRMMQEWSDYLDGLANGPKSSLSSDR